MAYKAPERKDAKGMGYNSMGKYDNPKKDQPKVEMGGMSGNYSKHNPKKSVPMVEEAKPKSR